MRYSKQPCNQWRSSIKRQLCRAVVHKEQIDCLGESKGFQKVPHFCLIKVIKAGYERQPQILVYPYLWVILSSAFKEQETNQDLCLCSCLKASDMHSRVSLQIKS